MADLTGCPRSLLSGASHLAEVMLLFFSPLNAQDLNNQIIPLGSFWLSICHLLQRYDMPASLLQSSPMLWSPGLLSDPTVITSSRTSPAHTYPLPLISPHTWPVTICMLPETINPSVNFLETEVTLGKFCVPAVLEFLRLWFGGVRRISTSWLVCGFLWRLWVTTHKMLGIVSSTYGGLSKCERVLLLVVDDLPPK